MIIVYGVAPALSDSGHLLCETQESSDRRKNVNRSELIDEVAARLEVNRKHAEEAVEAVMDTIKKKVAGGERVAISGFGIFDSIQRKARTARNPLTGDTIKVKAKSVPKFKPGAEFRKFVENPRAAMKKASASAKKAPAKTAAAAKKTTTSARATASAAKSTAKQAPAKTAAAAKKTATTARSTAAAAKTTAKSAAKKAPAKKAPAKKAPAKKAPAKKAPAKKAPAKKAPAKKAPAKK
jgi:DNA-binding protein HU-beta